LDRLCDHGVLERRRYSERPPRDEYVPTPKGRALRPVMVTLMQWGDTWQRDDEPLAVRTAGTITDGIRDGD
ncbi:MAG TPA: winged helix-turn-helix transcriptional regulator, partial [Ilumatobacteraceae bacterium]